MIETKFKIRKHIKKFELQFERANVRNQRKFMNVRWNTATNQSNMENSYFCVKTCWMKFCSGTNFIQHHPKWFFSSFSKLYKFYNCANHSNISSSMTKTWCWMKCWTGLLRSLYWVTNIFIAEKFVLIIFIAFTNIWISNNSTWFEYCTDSNI